jgi:NAD(P)-dependent dehydrogenase (short-subunit alcohol dehydrogenase family)
MAQQGADVAIIDICGPIDNLPYAAATDDDLEETAQLVKDAGGSVRHAVVDTRDAEALTSFLDDAVAELGGLDIAVANAGICIPGAWDDITPDVWNDTIDINLTGTWNTARAAAPHLIARGGGSMILTSSVAGLKVQPFLTPYVASKFGVTGLMHAFSVELAEHSVRVNSVHPTAVNSPMGSGNTGIPGLIAANPGLGALFSNSLPVGAIECEDVTDAVLFLASDAAKYITGHALGVDAGNIQR